MKKLLIFCLLFAQHIVAQDTINVSGIVFYDLNGDSIKQVNEPAVFNYILKDNISGTYAITNSMGFYEIRVINDSIIIAPGNLASYQSINASTYKNILIVSNTGVLKDSMNLNIPISCSGTCHHLRVDMTTSVLKKCDTNNIVKINFSNQGCKNVIGASIKVEIDTNIIDSILYPFTFVQNIDQLYFNIGNVNPFSQGSIELKVRVKCNVISGISNCLRATITPYSTCKPPTNYDNSNLSLKTTCKNDTIIATVSNLSGFDMNEPSKIVIYEDIIVQLSDTATIKNNQSKVYKYRMSPNSTATILLAQNINHPAQPILIQHNELCALKTNLKTNSIVNNFSRYDDKSEYVEVCGIINEALAEIQKSVIPSGFTINHYTPRDAKFSYRFDFKNLSNDTIKKILILDTLDASLDIQSFIPINASHPYSIRIINNNILEFKFENLVLLDSIKAPNGFTGYVQFYIVPRNLPAKNTLISNKYAIVFDNKTPKVSNAVINIMNDTVFVKSGNNQISRIYIDLKLFPNPASTLVFLELENEIESGSIRIIDMNGKVLLEKTKITGNKIQLNIEKLIPGNYILQVLDKNKYYFNKSLVIQ